MFGIRVKQHTGRKPSSRPFQGRTFATVAQAEAFKAATIAAYRKACNGMSANYEIFEV